MPTLVNRTTLYLAILLLPLLSAACEQPPLPKMQEVAGEYVAVELYEVIMGDSTNILTQGATMRLVLEADGTAYGRLQTPALSDGQARDIDLGDRWELGSTSIMYLTRQDRWVLMFGVLNRDRLVGEIGPGTGSGPRLRATLQRVQ